MNDALLIQQVYPPTGSDPLKELSHEYMAVNVAANQPYCDRHGFDYWHIVENLNPDGGLQFGSWGKVALVSKALEQGYQSVVWMDVDAVIWRPEVDLREACKPGHIGACWHRIPQLNHWNVGVLYFGDSESVRQFVRQWLSEYPGANDGWAEQGVFNRLAMTSNVVETLSDRWNATIHYTEVPDAVVIAYHGAGTPAERLQMVKDALGERERRQHG